MTEQAALDRLRELRDSIDNMDAALVHLLAERFKCTQAVGKSRPSTGCRPPTRTARPGRSRGCGKFAHSTGLDPTFAEEFLNLIIVHVIRSHESIKRDVDG